MRPCILNEIKIYHVNLLSKNIFFVKVYSQLRIVILNEHWFGQLPTIPTYLRELEIPRLTDKMVRECLKF